VQRVAGGGASAQPADCKEIRDEEKGKKEDMKKAERKSSRGTPRLKKGASQFRSALFIA